MDAERDPLLHEVEFPHEAIYYPYGFALRVRANWPALLEAAQTSWGMFAPESHETPLELMAGIAGEPDAPFPPPPVVRSRRHLLTTTGDGQHFGVCDFNAGFAYCWLTPRIFEDPAALRYCYLEALGYSLVAERHLTGVHAACVSLDGRGVLLCGGSGAGKSSLAYACARRGWTYISDDGSFLVRACASRTVVGNPHRIRFRPSARTLFPELRDLLAQPHPNGKMTIEVETHDLAVRHTAPRCPIRFVVFLNRQSGGAAGLLPFPKEEAFRQMQSVICYGRETTRDEQRASLRRLLEADVLELTYGDLDSAVDCLESLASR